VEREPNTRSAGASLLVTENRVESCANLLTQYGVEFETQETREGTQFLYSTEDFELAGRSYAEIQAREIAEQRRRSPQD
jgi:hypothetical protein